MIAIIAEKPSVGLDIAHVVGADTRNDGYCSGNGYMVTWALGHLVSLAMPDTYGYTCLLYTSTIDNKIVLFKPFEESLQRVLLMETDVCVAVAVLNADNQISNNRHT